MHNPLESRHEPSVWRQTLSYTLEIIKVFLIALIIVVPVRYFLIQPFYVKGASMEPNFVDHEYLIIDELSYRLREPVRGEVTVFRYPRNPKQYYIKRIIGMPGETVRVEDGKVFIDPVDADTFQLDESLYLDPNVTTQTFNYSEVTLGETEYFVMGDNRSSSYDSRHFGAVDDEFLVGRALVRVLPFDRVDWFGDANAYATSDTE